MPNSESNLHERVTELEIKISYQEDLIQELNNIVIAQQTQMDKLSKAYGVLNERLVSVCAEIGFVNQGEEIPPHY